jgi:glc operon protein GlcG
MGFTIALLDLAVHRLSAMKTKPLLALEDAKRVAAAAEAEALRNGWKVAIAVCDDGGHLLLLHRIDETAPISSTIAPAKARAAACGKRETKAYEDMINQGRTAFLSAPLDGMIEGGVPIMVDGQVVGAVGVSGVKSSEDAQIAKAGVAAL